MVSMAGSGLDIVTVQTSNDLMDPFTEEFETLVNIHSFANKSKIRKSNIC